VLLDDRAAADLQVVATWLARRDLPQLVGGPTSERFDVLVLCGSAVLASVEVAARAYHAGLVGHLLVTGGRGHSTPYLAAALAGHPSPDGRDAAERPEAETLGALLRDHHGVPARDLTLELEATNCGENAELALRMLAVRLPRARRLLLVQDPTMQRRTHAGFTLHAQRRGDRLTLASFAPLVPEVRAGAATVGSTAWPDVWSTERFVSLALGEVRRLRDDEHGYGPRGAGFLPHVDVPGAVEAAAHRLTRALPAELAER
jgi:hypothetical protein